MLPNNPEIVHKRQQYSPKLTVWCAVSQFGVIREYFFKGEGLPWPWIPHNIQTFLATKNGWDCWRTYIGNLSFQQNRATAHTVRISLDVLREMFPGHLVPLRGDVRWPARSPELSMRDYVFWGYLKEKVFLSHSQTLPDLKMWINANVYDIPHSMRAKATRNLRGRLQQCINEYH